ncbi:MAG TPA: ABC transporter substrate-binding protein [Rhodopila sp.]
MNTRKPRTSSLAGAAMPGRRAVILTPLAGMAFPVRRATAAVLPAVRLGVLQFGTVQWVADVIRRHGLDAANGFTLVTTPLANTDAGRVAIMAGQTDVVVSDWPFVAVQRAAGTRLCFAPFSTSTGGIMTPADSPIRTFVDIKGRRLGVVGGPTDKSWLVVQAAARMRDRFDLAAETQVSYGAPPLLGAKLMQGELDALLTFWNFAAKLEAAGYRQAIPVGECATALGLPAQLNLVGFVFHEEWAVGAPAAIDGFIAAVTEAERILTTSPAEWDAIRPLMQAPEDALFARLRDRFTSGVVLHTDVATEEQDASRLLSILNQVGGTRGTGGLETLPPGVFWRAGHGAG